MELRRALARRGHDPADVDGTLRRLRREGYLDDQGLARRFARSRIGGHGLGRNRVRARLRSRGVPRPALERGLSEALTEVSEAAGLDAVARRFWRSRVRDEPRVRLRKLAAFLLRRGFPADLVHDRLRALWPRQRETLDGLGTWLEPGDEENPTE